MKIAFFLGEFPSVSETFILNQIVGLIRRGHEIHINAHRPKNPPPIEHADVNRYALLDRAQYRQMPHFGVARFNSAAKGLIRIGWRHPRIALEALNVLRYRRQAMSLALLHEWLPTPHQERAYDVIQCHFGPNGQRAVAWRNVGALQGPIITTFHGYDANQLPRIYGRGLYKRLFNEGDMFTAGSEFMRGRLMRLGAPVERIVKLPMGVDLSRFRFFERTSTPAAELRLLTVARLVEVKGIAYALRAIAILRDKSPRLRYRIAGDGPLRRQLEGLAAQLGVDTAVEFLGALPQEEVSRQHQWAHLFVLPSIITKSGEEETQAVALIEAQASGLPVIATSVGGIAESLRDGVSGFLVPSRNPEALASAILRLAAHPETWGPMGRAGRKHVEQCFDLEKLNDELVELFGSVRIKHARALAHDST
jgi:colanic acid/amylovoran biosynthesis glycosyltransferase